jgi:hypothetical protein
MPIFNDALAALDTIKEADINYIKKLGNPPGAIKLVSSRHTNAVSRNGMGTIQYGLGARHDARAVVL